MEVQQHHPRTCTREKKERKDKSMKHKIDRRDQSEDLITHRPCNKIQLLVVLVTDWLHHVGEEVLKKWGKISGTQHMLDGTHAGSGGNAQVPPLRWGD